jgi:DNA (cytosine-5)-methyltransferase 1
MTISCVDLFCGAGGLSHGLQLGGIDVRAGVDLDPHCRYPYEENNKARFLEKSVEHLTAEEVKSFFHAGEISLLAGCAPCQPFSTYRKGKDTSGDHKWGLLKAFGKLIQQVQPDLVTMENVPQLPKHEVFKDFLACLEGYEYEFQVVNCLDYGVPQQRKRLVLLASKLGPIQITQPTHKPDEYVRVFDAIKNLSELKAGEADSNDSLHVSATLSEINMRRIRESIPGGTWRDWSPELVADCHKKKSGKSFPSVYGRMEWMKPAPTMTTLCYGFGNGRFGHPSQDRAISLREAAIFQTFPRHYKFTPPDQKINFKVIGRLIGNAVPVRLGEVIATSIHEHLEKQGINH